MRTRLPILLLLLLAGFSAHAAEVLRVGKDMTNIAVSHDETRTWMAKDRVCVLQRAREVGCGTVVKTTAKGAIVRLDAPSSDILAGDKVIGKFQAPAPAAAAAGTTPPGTPLLNSVPNSAESEIHNFNLSAGVAVGASFFYPTLAAQIALTPALAFGIGGLFFSYPNSLYTLTAFGGLATLNYYSQDYFRGLWLQGGAGVTYFSVASIGSPTETATCLTGLGTVGWRGYWDLGLNIGVGAGFQYTAVPSFSAVVVGSAGFQPLVILDVGFSF